jgi:hypothetical protein
MIGGGRSLSCVRSLRASRAPAELKSVMSFSVEEVKTSILEFSLGYVVTGLNKRGAEGETSASPNRRGVLQKKRTRM